MNDAPSTTLNLINNSNIKTYIVGENKFALNSTWNEDLLRRELLGLKSTKFEMNPLRFDLKEKADITVDREIDQPEYDESAADDIEMITYPECGKSFPR